VSVSLWLFTGLNLAVACWLWWLLGWSEGLGRPRRRWFWSTVAVALVNLLVVAWRVWAW
jgi:hypothetical protein